MVFTFRVLDFFVAALAFDSDVDVNIKIYIANFCALRNDFPLNSRIRHIWKMRSSAWIPYFARICSWVRFVVNTVFAPMSVHAVYLARMTSAITFVAVP